MNSVIAVVFILLPLAVFDGVLPGQDAPAPSIVASSRPGFIAVDGASLSTRIDAAVARGRSTAPEGKFWVAYGFRIRSGVAVDFELRNAHGVTTINGLTIQDNVRAETPRVAVFLLYEPESVAPSRVEIYNLDRNRTYGDHPVYWTGIADSNESLELLKGMVLSSENREITRRSVVAIGLHADPRAAEILESIVLASN